MAMIRFFLLGLLAAISLVATGCAGMTYQMNGLIEPSNVCETRLAKADCEKALNLQEQPKNPEVVISVLPYHYDIPRGTWMGDIQRFRQEGDMELCIAYGLRRVLPDAYIDIWDRTKNPDVKIQSHDAVFYLGHPTFTGGHFESSYAISLPNGRSVDLRIVDRGHVSWAFTNNGSMTDMYVPFCRLFGRDIAEYLMSQGVIKKRELPDSSK